VASETVHAFLNVFNVLIKNQKRDFLRFFELLHTFSRTSPFAHFLFTFLHFWFCAVTRTAAVERTLNWRHVQGRICVCGGPGQDHY